MKLFAIITAGLMAAGGGAYLYSTSTCSKSACSAPVAKTGGCCAKETVAESECCEKQEACCEKVEACCADATAKKTKAKACCAAQEECCVTVEACCAVATGVTAQVKADACCATKEACCLVQAACCTAESVRAVAKPREIKGCCDEACSTTVQTVISAASSIVNVK